MSLAAVALTAHECMMCIIKSLTLTAAQQDQLKPTHGRPVPAASTAARSGGEAKASRGHGATSDVFGSGRRMSELDVRAASLAAQRPAPVSPRSRASRRPMDGDTNPLQNDDAADPGAIDFESMRGMLRVSWASVDRQLCLVLQHCSERRLVHDALRSYQTLTNTCGVLGLTKVQDTLLKGLCAFALPGGEQTVGAANEHARKVQAITTGDIDPDNLQPKHILVLETQKTANSLVSRSSKPFLRALAKACSIVYGVM